MDEILFISDCHLSDDGTETSRLLIEFLTQRASKASAIYILGDLFEVWLGDDSPADEHRDFLTCLDRLSQRCPVFFIAGNRDFLLGEAFASQHNIQLLHEPIAMKLGDKRVVLLHGDILCTDDIDYQNFRKLVRNPGWQTQFLQKPLVERQAIAAALREDSKAAMQQKSNEIMDVNENAVLDCFEQNDANVIIHGHTHRPAKHSYDADRTRYVLGDWSPGPSFLSWTPDNEFMLEDFRFNRP